MAQRAGVSIVTVRYYESIGLLKRARRTAAGHRRYSEETVAELRFVKKAQALNFSLTEIAAILETARAGRPVAFGFPSLDGEHSAAVERRIGHLKKLSDALASELAKWDRHKIGVVPEGLCDFVAAANLPVKSSPGRAGRAVAGNVRPGSAKP